MGQKWAAIFIEKNYSFFYDKIMAKKLVVYTDGGCIGNPGPGGWAYIVTNLSKELFSDSGYAKETTNNKMELTAVIESLNAIREKKLDFDEIIINTDSQYVKNGITQWITNWKKNGWRTANKKEVKNKEYWIALDLLNSILPVTWQWVKGHSGVELNEKCDAMVHLAIEKNRDFA